MIGHIGVGWKAAIPDLAGEESRFWVSAYITEIALDEVVRRGDRVLIRGLARDFAYESSRLRAVRRLLERGVEVRRLERLHAKVFVREVKPRPIAWIGSANMTTRGRSDGRDANLEAMAGPVLLEPQEMARLNAWWSEASPISEEVLVDLERQAKVIGDQDAIDRLVEKIGVVALRLSFRSPETSFRIPDKWFEKMDQAAAESAWQGVVTTVPYRVASDGSDSSRDCWTAVREALSGGLRRSIAEPVEGASGLYVLHSHDRAQLDEALSSLNARLATILHGPGQPNASSGQASFELRAREVMEALALRRPRSAEWSQITSELRESYTRFASSRGYRVGYVFFLPLSAEDEQFEKAVRSFKEQPVALFELDRRQRIDRLLATVLATAEGMRL